MSAPLFPYVPSPTQLNLTDSLGALLIGAFISTSLVGISLSQTSFYYKVFPKDPRLFKIVVGLSCLVNFIHAIFVVECIWFWMIANFGNTAALDFVSFAYNANLTLTGLLTLLVQSFFAHRIYTLSHRSPYLPILIVLLSLLQFAFGLACTIRAVQLVRQSLFGSFTWGVDVWFYASATADFVIAASVVAYLKKEGKGAWGGTKGVVERLIAITLESNLLTAVLSIIVAITFSTIRNGWPNAINFVAVRMYYSSLLVNLNARADLAKKLESSGPGNPPAFHLSPVGQSKNMIAGIHVMSRTTTEVDDPSSVRNARKLQTHRVQVGPGAVEMGLGGVKEEEHDDEDTGMEWSRDKESRESF